MSRLARWARSFGLTRALCVLLLFALVPLRILDPPPLEELRLRTFDIYQTLQPRESASGPVVIVDIDEASLKEIGQWPQAQFANSSLRCVTLKCTCKRPNCRSV